MARRFQELHLELTLYILVVSPHRPIFLTSAVGIEVHFSQISRIVETCHLDFTFVRGSYQSSLQQNFFGKFGDIVLEMKNRVTVSVCVENISVNFDTISYQSCYHDTVMSLVGMQVTCLIRVHVFALKEHLFPVVNLWLLQESMKTLLRQGIWPHHYIHVGKLLSRPNHVNEIQQLYALSHEASVYFLRGAIIFLNFRTNRGSIICITCFPHHSLVFYSINLGEISKLHDLQDISKQLNSDLRGGFVHDLFISHMKSEGSCSIRVVSSHHELTDFSDDYDSCLYHILKRKFNFTFQIPENPAKVLFFAHRNHMLNSLFDEGVYWENGAYEWSSFLVDFFSPSFIAYQERSYVTASALLKPFGWEVWVLFFLSAFGLVMLTAAVEDIQKLKSKVPFVLWDIISSILDQCLSRNVQVSVNGKVQNLMPYWLRV